MFNEQKKQNSKENDNIIICFRVLRVFLSFRPKSKTLPQTRQQQLISICSFVYHSMFSFYSRPYIRILYCIFAPKLEI
jgi:hypothetical protein